MRGKFFESEFEEAFVEFLKALGWEHSFGEKLCRLKNVALIESDFKGFLQKSNLNLTSEEVEQIYDKFRFMGAASEFETLHKIYDTLVNGMSFKDKNAQTKMMAHNCAIIFVCIE